MLAFEQPSLCRLFEIALLEKARFGSYYFSFLCKVFKEQFSYTALLILSVGSRQLSVGSIFLAYC